MKWRPDMHDYTPAARWYWWITVTLGGAAIVHASWQGLMAPWGVIAIVAAGAIVAALVGLVPVHIPGLRASVVCGDIFIVLTLMLVGVFGGVLVVACESFIGSIRSSKRWTSRIGSPAMNASSVYVCGTAFEALRPQFDTWFAAPAGLFVAATSYGVAHFLISMAAMRMLLALKNRQPIRLLRWYWEGLPLALWAISSACVAALIYIGLRNLGWSALLVAMPIIAMFLATYYALARNADMSRRKSEFLAHMSHELRTPLNAIIGGSEVLKDGVVGPLNERQGQWARDIHESGEHLLAVINDILDISRIEAGRMPIDRTTVKVDSVVEGAITLVKDAAARKRIDLRIEVPPDVGAFAVDERKVKQVLLNLLSNAIKFTPEGGRVSVMARRDGAAVELAVRDTGVGIAPEDQDTVFDAFRQVGKDAAAKATGSGLGLTLARDLVVLHGGTLTLESAPGRGSIFTMRLP